MKPLEAVVGPGLEGIGSHAAVPVEIRIGVVEAEEVVAVGPDIENSCWKSSYWDWHNTEWMPPPRHTAEVGYGDTVAAGDLEIGLVGGRLVGSHIAGVVEAAAADGDCRSGGKVSQFVDRREASCMEYVRCLRCIAAAMDVAAAEVDGAVDVGYYEGGKTLSQQCARV